jgi:hypothetical protein
MSRKSTPRCGARAPAGPCPGRTPSIGVNRFLLVAVLALVTAPAQAAGPPGHDVSVSVVGPGSSVTPSAWEVGDGKGLVIDGSVRLDYRYRPFRTSLDQVSVYHPLRQSFRFSIRNDGPRARVSFETSLRGGLDLWSGGFQAEVMYAYVDVAPTKREGFVRIGRQLSPRAGSSGLLRFDGVRARVAVWRLGFEAFGGVPLRSRVFFGDETSGFQQPIEWGKDWTYGFGVFLAGQRSTQLRIGFHDRFKVARLARRHLTLDFHQGILGRLNVRANFAVDMLQRRFSEVVAGIEGRPVRWMRAVFEFEHLQPSFDADTVWSVFNTDPFDAARGRIILRPIPQIAVEAGGGVQVMPEAVSRDNVPSDIGRVSGTERVTVTLRPIPMLTVRLSERLLHGAGGLKFTATASARVRPFDGRLEVGVRGDYQRYAYELQPGLTGDYGDFAVDLVVRPMPWVRASLSTDLVFSPWLENHVQVTASLSFLLGVKARTEGTSRQQTAARLTDWQPALMAISRDFGAAPWDHAFAGLTTTGDR